MLFALTTKIDTSQPKIDLSPIAIIEPAPVFPDFSQRYQQTIVIPAKLKADCEAKGGTYNAPDCVIPPPPPVIKPRIVYRAPAPATSNALTGSIGYLVAGPNCVDLARRYGKNQNGNPITWRISTRTPFIGAAALFYYNHVGIVTGIWSNGDIEIIQENAPGAPHRYSQSEFRGFF